MENRPLFKRVVWGLSAFILALFVLVTVIVTRPDAYEDHLEHGVQSATTTWPDGSPRTANDWWAHPSNVPPATPQG